MNHFYFQPRNFRHELVEREGCAPPVTLKPVMQFGVGIITAASIAGVAGIAGALISSDSSSNAAQQQANAQLTSAQLAAKSQSDTNAQNLSEFQQARGSEGSAIFPTYMTGLEKELGTNLQSDYNNSAVPLSSFQKADAGLIPAEAGAVKTTNDIFNGGITNQMLASAQPVEQAQLATAKSSSLDALSKTLDQIDAQQASHGFGGDSYANRLASFQGYKAQGDAVGAANLSNLQTNQDIKNYGNITLPMNNLTTPYNMAQQAGQMAFLPQSQYLNSVGQRMNNLNMMRLGYTQPFQATPLPTPGAGAFSGSANASLAQAAGATNVGNSISSAATQLFSQQQTSGAGGVAPNSSINLTAQDLTPITLGGPPTATDALGASVDSSSLNLNSDGNEFI